MTTVPDQRNQVYHEEPPARTPPMMVVGPLAWIRDNLFATPIDIVLTILGTITIAAVITSFISWTVGAANWFLIIFNLRQYMIGRYEPAYEWRIQLLVLIIAFIVGFCIATWGRISRRLATIVLVLVALSFVLPVLIDALIPMPYTYFTAANVEITSGSDTEESLPRVAFIGKAGEQVGIEIAYDLSLDDPALANQYSFADIATNALRNNAANRLSAQIERSELEARIAGDSLTPRQREQVTGDLEDLEIPEPIVETYTLNQQPIAVRILDGATLEPIAEGTLNQETPSLNATLPNDGWYVLEKQIEGDTPSAAILRTRGIYPHLERNFTSSDSAGVIGSGRVNQYVRMTDSFTTEAVRPRIDDEDVPMAIIIDNRYRGTSPLSDYLTLYFAPILRQINVAFALVVALVAVGYFACRLIEQNVKAKNDRPRQRTQRMAIWMLIAVPVLMFLLIYGVAGLLPVTDTRRWGGLMLSMMLTVVGIVGSFPLGVLLALGRRSKLPVISTACTLFIEFVRGVPLITVLFMVQLLLPLANPALAEVDNVFRAMAAIVVFSAAYLAENVRGGLQSIPPGQEEAAKALGLNAIQVTLFITLPQALRAVIPALVGQFISLFKDTSLVAIVGLLDLTGMARVISTQTEFIGLQRESYLFIAAIYFTFSYVMAFVSRRIEESGSGAARRV
jgi:His/Glu/Gln/Arg/opine family amino acid ABC transporter permease subunit